MSEIETESIIDNNNPGEQNKNLKQQNNTDKVIIDVISSTCAAAAAMNGSIENGHHHNNSNGVDLVEEDDINNKSNNNNNEVVNEDDIVNPEETNNYYQKIIGSSSSDSSSASDRSSNSGSSDDLSVPLQQTTTNNQEVENTTINNSTDVNVNDIVLPTGIQSMAISSTSESSTATNPKEDQQQQQKHSSASDRYEDVFPSLPGNKKKCEDIANKHGVKVEISCSKDQSLHVVLSGVEDRVLEAKRSIIQELQMKTMHQIRVPKEHHKFLIGAKGVVLKELQEKTCTTIQVPKTEANSELISITGPKDGIEQAIHEIQLICDEQSKTGFERLNIPKMYHPWIRGYNNEVCNDIAQRTGAKINIPPPQIEKDEIAVSGERDKVDAACAEIKRLYALKSKVKITKLSIQITKSQHKLVIGQKGTTVQETFRDFDVYVQVPKLESPSETIFLYGEDSKLGAALTHVCQKANSIVNIALEAPSWLHRYLIGEKGTNISKITADFPNTHVEFEQDNKITLEGPPEEVEKVRERLENIIVHFKSSLACEEITVNPKYYPQLVGKKYENIARFNKEYGVLVRVPQHDSPNSTNNNASSLSSSNSSVTLNNNQLNNQTVRIEGAPDAVQKAKIEFLEMVKRVENERSKDIIIDQKYHSNIIGKSGKNLNELRAKFNDIQIQIPNQEDKSDVVTIRGNKLDVEKCFKHLQQIVKEMQESNYQDELHIFKQFHRMLIGKHGAFIRKIREDTQTRIDVPAEDSESDSILIVGRQENVLKARKLIEDALIGRGGAIIKQIRKDCGGVIINFPPEQQQATTSTTNDRITLKGPRDEIEKAKQELSKMAKQKNDMNYTEEVVVKAEYHRFLVGKKGTSINSMREKHNVRIILPTVSALKDNNNNKSDSTASSNNAAETITIVGKEENVKNVRVEIEALVKQLQEQITDEVHVDPKWHKSFTAKRAKLINKISDENCNVNISFPKQSTSDLVVIKGPKDAVESAKKRIKEIVFDLENHVTIECFIPQKHHVNLIGKKGNKSSQLSDEFKVEIQFPAKSLSLAANSNSNEQVNSTPTTPNETTSSDIVLISGLKDDCERAKQALLDLIPISVDVTFPQKFHKNLLENKAEILRSLGDKHDVQINVPKKGGNNNDSNFVTIVGTKECIEDAKQALLDQVLVDLEHKNFSVSINEIKPELIPQLRGRNGIEANKLEKKFDVRIDFSRKGEPDRIVIKGIKQNVLDCESFIRKKITDEQSKQVQEIEIDNRVHSRIIGQKGRTLAKLMEKYKVEVKFSGRQSDIVIVKGDSSEAVDDACDALKNLEEEYLQDVIDKEAYTHPSSKTNENDLNGKQNGQSKGFVVKGAPWEQQQQSATTGTTQQHNNNNNLPRNASFNPNEPVPDTSNMEDFPTITSAVADGQSQAQKMTWGPSRR